PPTKNTARRPPPPPSSPLPPPPVPPRRRRRRWRLALGVLRCLTGLLEAVLLPLLDPRVTGDEARLLQRRAVLRVDDDERAGQAETQRARLTGDAATGDAGDHIELGLRAQGHERLVDEPLVHLVRRR